MKGSLSCFSFPYAVIGGLSPVLSVCLGFQGEVDSRFYYNWGDGLIAACCCSDVVWREQSDVTLGCGKKCCSPPNVGKGHHLRSQLLHIPYIEVCADISFHMVYCSSVFKETTNIP